MLFYDQSLTKAVVTNTESRIKKKTLKDLNEGCYSALIVFPFQFNENSVYEY